ncbi:DUF3221 domain-containing protein [Paenibacillus sp. L3-i20]|uniref:DUF3221 domain-containing protein n=1 Tax=Paenibacillus sp. L3-i20 TaxID=2905833 RepID=UPI001EDE56DB|nr:DUF3221 domain-containing protein [Paenibacillus sp. L3-i20]GKU78907.1 hypothetical protein L3i20_v233040 [Paenibacillus sp. L3-i20]
MFKLIICCAVVVSMLTACDVKKEQLHEDTKNNIQNKIVSSLKAMDVRGPMTVGFNAQNQKVVVDAYITEEQKSQLIDKYGDDLIEVNISEIVSGLVGYVVRVENGKILVVDPNVQDYGAQGGEKFFYNASWYSNAPDEVKVGQKVEVKVIEGPITTQYPGDSTAEKVIIIPHINAGNAILLEEEAIRKAMASNEYQHSIAATDEWLPVIKGATYNEKTSMWTVNFTNKSTDQVISIPIEDEQ